MVCGGVSSRLHTADQAACPIAPIDYRHQPGASRRELRDGELKGAHQPVTPPTTVLVPAKGVANLNREASR